MRDGCQCGRWILGWGRNAPVTPMRRPPEGEGQAPSHRNAYLRLDDAALLKQCHQERYRASGPGGQPVAEGLLRQPS
jgi:hypothetical protein